MAVSCEKNILCINGFGKVWRDQGEDNQNQLFKAFEKRYQDITKQQRFREIRDIQCCV